MFINASLILIPAIVLGFYCGRALETVLRRWTRSLLVWFQTLSPGKVVPMVSNSQKLAELLTYSGLSGQISVHALLAIKRIGLRVSLGLLAIKIVWTFDFGFQDILAAIALGFISLRWPELYFSVKSRKHANLVNKELPAMLDYLQMYLNSGLNLENSFKEFAEQYRGHFKKEWQLFKIRMDRGSGLSEALAGLIDGSPSLDFRRIVGNLIQSQKLGVSVGQTLAIHADMLRGQRKRTAESKAKSAGVKISLPVIFFIFPAVLIIFLGPAILQMVEMFKNF